MLADADTIQKSVLEWLQLRPELLSGLPQHAAVPVQPAPLAAATRGSPLDVATIDLQTVSPSAGMGFLAPPTAPAPQPELWQRLVAQAYPVAGRAYNTLEQGGQQSALAEMREFLAAGLVPGPVTPRG